jgi:sirohydrochlorin ferrochelatase
MKKALLVVDHGSRVHEANEMLRTVGELVAAEAPGYHVEVAHMELAEPTIEQGLASCVAAGARDITVHPYMLSPGRHATEDIPRMVAEAMRQHPGVAFRVSAPLGTHPLLARVVLERATEAETTNEKPTPR